MLVLALGLSVLTTWRLALLYCAKHLLHFDEARQKAGERGWEEGGGGERETERERERESRREGERGRDRAPVARLDVFLAARIRCWRG